MNLYLENVEELSVGELYEMSLNDRRARVPWFESHDLNRSAEKPDNGTFVVYLGKGKDGSIYHHSMLSSEGKMYKIYNRNFVYGLKRIKSI